MVAIERDTCASKACCQGDAPPRSTSRAWAMMTFIATIELTRGERAKDPPVVDLLGRVSIFPHPLRQREAATAVSSTAVLRRALPVAMLAPTKRIDTPAAPPAACCAVGEFVESHAASSATSLYGQESNALRAVWQS